jgi:EAL and modified HD-GYP domain-containing signal transduction protein
MDSSKFQIARQPILNRDEETVGYELLYGGGVEAAARFTDTDEASRRTLDASLLMDIELLSGGHRVFLNCTYELLAKELATLVPSEKVVLEIADTVACDEHVLEACRKLKACGYTLALDNFVPGSNTLPFLPCVDILKIDVQHTALNLWPELIRHYGKNHQTVALKVETRKQYQNARQAGFTHFQGYYFCEPAHISHEGISPLRVSQIRMLKTACDPELDFRQLEEIIKSDAALCYRLLRYMNSAAFYVHSSVNSIRHALALLGEREIRKWIAITAVSIAGEDRPREVVLSALLRARFCELLWAQVKCRAYDLFIVGLFSVMEALLDAPLERILIEIEIPPMARAALLGKPVRLREAYDLVLAYIKADWPTCQKYCERLNIAEEDLKDAYISSVQWVDSLVEISNTVAAAPIT